MRQFRDRGLRLPGEEGVPLAGHRNHDPLLPHAPRAALRADAGLPEPGLQPHHDHERPPGRQHRGSPREGDLRAPVQRHHRDRQGRLRLRPRERRRAPGRRRQRRQRPDFAFDSVGDLVLDDVTSGRPRKADPVIRLERAAAVVLRGTRPRRPAPGPSSRRSGRSRRTSGSSPTTSRRPPLRRDRGIVVRRLTFGSPEFRVGTAFPPGPRSIYATPPRSRSPAFQQLPMGHLRDALLGHHGQLHRPGRLRKPRARAPEGLRMRPRATTGT